MKDIYVAKIGHQVVQREVGGFRKDVGEAGGSGESSKVRKGCTAGVR